MKNHFSFKAELSFNMQRILLPIIVLLTSCKLSTSPQSNHYEIEINCLKKGIMVEAKSKEEIGYSDDSTLWRLFYFSKPMQISSLSAISDKKLLSALKNKEFIVDTVNDYCLSYIFLKNKKDEAIIKLSFFDCEGTGINNKEGFTLDFHTKAFSQDSIKLYQFLNNYSKNKST